MRTKVLYVEDEKVDQMAFKRFVKDHSLLYAYTIVGSVSKAKEVLDTDRFDIIVADYKLGDGNAFDIFNLIVDTPIIVITGHGDEEIAVKAMKNGAYDYLIKDIEHNYLDALPTTIEKAIERKKIEYENMTLINAIMEISDSVYITDMNNKLIFANCAFCEMYGYKKEEVIGMHASEMMLEAVERDACKEKGHFLEDYGRRKDGSKFPILWIEIVVKDKIKGVELGKVRIVRDITEKKREEKEREKLIAELQKPLAEIKTLTPFLTKKERDFFKSLPRRSRR